MHFFTASILLATILGGSPVLAKGGPMPLPMPECFDAAHRFPGKFFVPGTAEYAATLQSYQSAFEQDIRPACVFRPTCAEDVSRVVKQLKDSTTKLAIKGGGFMGNPGAANVDGGITMDMVNITGVNLDASSKVVSIGAGERWKNLYATLETQGLAVTGSRVSDVGVGGLILGGGLSYFDGKGFVCDNVVNFQAVLASGDLVNANATANPDLFAALKGGSNNFGVVTRFDLTTFPQREYWGGGYAYNASAIPQLFETFTDYVSQQDLSTHVFVATGFTKGSEFGTAHVFDTEGNVSRPSLTPFGQIQPQLSNTTRSASLLSFADEESTYDANGARTLFFTTSFRFDPDLIKPVYDIFNASYGEIRTVADLSISLTFQVIPKEMIAKSNALGPNSLGLKPEDGPLVLVIVTGSHSHAADDEKMLYIYRSVIRAIDLLAAAKYKEARFRYLNYAYKDEAVVPSYGPDSVAKLQAVSKKYDPEGFFQKGVPGGFKLPHA